jgi:hypothetical protein
MSASFGKKKTFSFVFEIHSSANPHAAIDMTESIDNFGV